MTPTTIGIPSVSGNPPVFVGASVSGGYSGVWIGTAASSLTTTVYNLLGDNLGNTFLNCAGATRAVHIRCNNGGGNVNGDGITVDANGAHLYMPIYVNAYNTVGTSLTNSVFNVVPYGTTVLQRGSAWSSNTFTVPETGVYYVRATAGIVFPSSTNCVITISIYVNGGETTRGVRMDIATPAGLGTEGVQVSDFLSLSAGNTLQVQVYQASGANRTLNGVATDNRLTILGPF
jgi:hypothetical protein